MHKKAIRVGALVLALDPGRRRVEAGADLPPERVRVVADLGCGLYRVEDEDGVRWTAPREDLTPCE